MGRGGGECGEWSDPLSVARRHVNVPHGTFRIQAGRLRSSTSEPHPPPQRTAHKEEDTQEHEDEEEGRGLRRAQSKSRRGQRSESRLTRIASLSLTLEEEGTQCPETAEGRRTHALGDRRGQGGFCIRRRPWVVTHHPASPPAAAVWHCERFPHAHHFLMGRYSARLFSHTPSTLNLTLWQVSGPGKAQQTRPLLQIDGTCSVVSSSLPPIFSISAATPKSAHSHSRSKPSICPCVH